MWDLDFDLFTSTASRRQKREMKRVPKGTSQYQAAWIMEAENAEEEEEEEESELVRVISKHEADLCCEKANVRTCVIIIIIMSLICIAQFYVCTFLCAC